MRMEDLDTPRVVEGSDRNILNDLEWLGIDWDGAVLYQSMRQEQYVAAFNALNDAGLLYPCFCSRKELREIASAPHGGTPIYPGICADLSPEEVAQKNLVKKPATRLRVDTSRVHFEDGLLGSYSQCLSDEVGDFVIKRADGLFAYQLAVTVDDIDQGVTHIVRGADLIESTARQLYVMRRLRRVEPNMEYWHLPLVIDKDGHRLAKRDGSDSAARWRDKGLTPAEMIGKFAFDLKLIDQPAALNAHELLAQISYASLHTSLLAASKSN